jgi:hypothetical protein
MTDRASYLERGIKFRRILYYNEIIREIKKKTLTQQLCILLRTANYEVWLKLSFR